MPLGVAASRTLGPSDTSGPQVTAIASARAEATHSHTRIVVTLATAIAVIIVNATLLHLAWLMFAVIIVVIAADLADQRRLEVARRENQEILTPLSLALSATIGDDNCAAVFAEAAPELATGNPLTTTAAERTLSAAAARLTLLADLRGCHDGHSPLCQHRRPDTAPHTWLTTPTQEVNS